MSSSFEDDSVVEEEVPAAPSHSSIHPLVKLAHTYDESHTPRKSRLSKKRSAINGLQTALQEGMVIPLDKDEFRWSHDRFSQAAMSMVSPSVGEQIHYKIAIYYLQGNVCGFYVYFTVYFFTHHQVTK
jgi:hypothetical protein